MDGYRASYKYVGGHTAGRAISEWRFAEVDKADEPKATSLPRPGLIIRRIIRTTITEMLKAE